MNTKEKELSTVLKKSWKNPEGIRTEFSNDMTINHTDDEFFISFWRTELPTVFDPDELKKMKEIDTVLVAKVVVTSEFAKKVNKALEDNIKKHESRMKNK
jgi:hypothetical protein